MSAPMKTHHTEIQIRAGEKVFQFTDVPTSKIKPILASLKDYSDEALPWRNFAAARIKAAGGESAHMVRSSREIAGMTQTELAKRLGMPQANVSQVETGRRSVGKTLAKRLAKIFNVDYRVFL